MKELLENLNFRQLEKSDPAQTVGRLVYLGHGSTIRTHELHQFAKTGNSTSGTQVSTDTCLHS